MSGKPEQIAFLKSAGLSVGAPAAIEGVEPDRRPLHSILPPAAHRSAVRALQSAGDRRDWDEVERLEKAVKGGCAMLCGQTRLPDSDYCEKCGETRAAAGVEAITK